MRKVLIFLLLLTAAASVSSQTAHEEILRDRRYSASNMLAYPGPKQQALTPPPPGMKPFYISHYGRHGSRFHTRPAFYNAPFYTLHNAARQGRLTDRGRRLMESLDTIRCDAHYQWGELTDLGAEQHRQIVTRMYERFPEVFADSAVVRGQSTHVLRCILSMENALLHLQQLNPRLNIAFNATQRYISFLNYQDRIIFKMRMDSVTLAAFKDFKRRNIHLEHLTGLLFNDRQWVADSLDTMTFGEDLYKVVSILQNSDIYQRENLYDLFTDDEIYNCWRVNNAWWYAAYGNSDLNGRLQSFTQRQLVDRIISEADESIANPQPGALLRFGHETVVLPLVCLLDIGGFGLNTTNLDELESRGWVDYRVFPMGANLQFVFYRRNPSDQDVLFKVLLNENETTLPLPTDMPPYYRWSDFKDYWKRLRVELQEIRDRKLNPASN